MYNLANTRFENYTKAFLRLFGNSSFSGHHDTKYSVVSILRDTVTSKLYQQ